jgi:NitT/TauT family transport system substrate-binding protein
VVTWGGYAGGQYFNRGFKPNAESKFREKYGMDVEFVLQDDYQASRDAWKADKVDLLWTTADSFVTESKSLKDYNPKVVFQADWSRGGDAIVAVRGINSVADLKGKKVSVAFGTPSHTFLLWLLSAGGLAYSDIQVVQAPSAIDSAAYFKARQVDAAVVWSPDDADCVASVTGSKVLQSTKSASNIIGDVFYAKQSFLEAHPTEVKNLIEGWLEGAAELNSSDSARHQAAKILAAGEQQPEDNCYKSILNVRLCTYGDNVNFFNLQGNYQGVKGEELYTKMQVLYTKLGLASDDSPAWRLVSDTSFLRNISLAGPENAAEGKAHFTAISASQAENLGAVATKRATVNFASGSATLDDEAKGIIDTQFADISRTFGHSRILISGNTDNTGAASLNDRLSKLRAQAVANYLTQQYHFDHNRFTIKGNGSNQPVASNDDPDGRQQNRRTDFELLNAQ